jgi:hypothetical protein
MNTNHSQENSENPSTKQSNAEPVWEQLDLFEWAFLYDEGCVGFAMRAGL